MKTSQLTRRPRLLRNLGTKPHTISFAVLCAAVGLPVASQGQGYLPEPANPAYYTYVAVAGQDLELDQNVQATGDLHANEEVELEQGVLVTGDVSAVDGVDNSGTVTGAINEDAETVTLPAPPPEAEARILADRIFEGDTEFSLDEVIDDIVFVNGDARFEAALNGTGAVIAMGDIRLEEGSAGQLLPGTSLSLIAHGDVRLDDEREFRGVLVAAEDIEIKEASSFEGVAIAGGDIDVDEDSELIFLQLDSEGPLITDLQPPDGASVMTTTPTISANFSDGLSGVDTSTFQLLVDGVDHSADATTSSSGFVFVGQQGLANGAHAVAVQLSDTVGNSSAVGWSFQVLTQADTEPPTFASFQPANGSVLSAAVPTISAAFSDDLSGIDPQTFQLLFDDIDRTADAAVTGSGFSFTPAEELENSLYFVEVFLADLAGNLGEDAWSFVVAVDSEAPSLAIILPTDPVVFSAPDILAEYADSGAGLELTSLRVLLDGLEITAACTVNSSSVFCSPSVGPGSHLIEMEIADLAGNSTSASQAFDFFVDTVAPTLAITSPSEGLLVSTPTVLIEGTAADDHELAQVTVNGAAASLSAGNFTAPVSLAEGINAVQVTAIDDAGNQTSTSVSVLLDMGFPQLSVSSPSDGTITNLPSVGVQGSASDTGGVAELNINGSSVPLNNGTFDFVVALVEGVNTLLVSATDAAGNQVTRQLEVTRFEVPAVEITSPADLSSLGVGSVAVAGTVSPSVASVTVNGVVANINGGSFTAPVVPLAEGSNILTASATDSLGRFSTDSIVVLRDTSPPRVVIHHPTDGGTVTNGLIAVRGLVTDVVPGTVNAQQVTVDINGLATSVANRAFLLDELTLVLGVNTLTATAVDQNGNSSSSSVTVSYVPSNDARIAIVSGNLQSGVIDSALPEPLIVELVDAGGQPVEGITVLFKVVDNDGSLDGGARRIAASTDVAGRASASFTLGLHAGSGVQVVEASAVAFGRTEFFQTGLPGEPSLIVVDHGTPQIGIVGRGLPRPLVALVVDNGFNRLEGVSVEFAFTKGGGLFGNGLGEVIVATDSDGRAIVSPDLGPEPGVSNNVITASVTGRPEIAPAVFVASARVAGDPAETVVSGIVLDNSDLPVPGVTIEIAGTAHSVQTDANGVFAIQGAPVGMVHLVADGSTTTRPGQWPHLEFTLTTIPGADNTLGRPIHMLPLDTFDELFVDESTGGVLTLSDYPGFALEIEPDSVLFPDGTRSGTIKVVPVHSDKVPMTPTAGQQPMLAVTIQPVGALFDPPARISFPNTCGLPAGTTVEFFSFDHDLEQFVSIGPSVVSEDGLVIVSKEGFGVIKAGWHWPMGPFGLPTSCPNLCGQCALCFGGGCLPVPGGCDDGNDCTMSDACSDGGCAGIPVEVEAIDGPCVLSVSELGTYTASSNAPEKLEWEARGGNPETGPGSSFSTMFSSAGSKTVEVGCEQNKMSKEIDVGVPCSTSGEIPINKDKVAAPLTPSQAGATDHIDAAPNFGGCVDDAGMWCTALESVDVKYFYGVANALPGREDIPNNPVATPPVTKGKCKAIIADFTPSIVIDNNLVPARSEYWSRSITVEHEDWHEMKLLEAYDAIAMAFRETLQGRCEECNTNAPPEEFLPEFDAIVQNFYDAWKRDSHNLIDGAWVQSNASYARLVQDIKSNLAQPSWPELCKN